MTDATELKVGKEQEVKRLGEGQVLVVGMRETEVVVNKAKKKQLRLICDHAESKQPIELNKVKLLRDKVVKTEGLWISTDEEGLLSYNSALANLLRFYKVQTPKELVEKEKWNNATKGLQVMFYVVAIIVGILAIFKMLPQGNNIWWALTVAVLVGGWLITLIVRESR